MKCVDSVEQSGLEMHFVCCVVNRLMYVDNVKVMMQEFFLAVEPMSRALSIFGNPKVLV